MYNDLKNEKIIVDMASYNAIKEIQLQDENRNDIDLYCDFMKERFLLLSGTN
jgi:hypothetical protein